MYKFAKRIRAHEVRPEGARIGLGRFELSVHNRVRSKDTAGRQRLARYMIRCPFALEKMRCDKKPGTVIYRSRLHANLKRNYQLMPALKWLRMLMNHIPDKYEHPIRYHGYYSNRSRGAGRLIENGN
jgi:hypothetical protein